MKTKVIAIIVVIAFILAGCVSTTQFRKDAFDYEYIGQFKGNYSAVARCVIDSLEKHENWNIGALDQQVRVYPDIKRSEVHAVVNSGLPRLPVFDMVINTESPNNLNVTIKGMPFEGGEALKALQECTDK